MKNRTMDAKRIVSRYGSLRTLLVVEGLLVGIFAGLVTSFYRYLLDRADDIRNAAIGFCSGNPMRMLGWFGVLVVLAVLVTLLLKWEPMISGSGIPQVEAELMGYIRPCWWRVILGKVAAGFLCIVGGLSLGREGPSVQLGGMAGKGIDGGRCSRGSCRAFAPRPQRPVGCCKGGGISRGLKRFRLEEHFLITCGASAGLSAAFNAPLAGVMFALEEIHKNFSAMVLLSCMAASLVADYISSGLFGMEPVFTFQFAGMIPLRGYAYILILGVLCGVLGAVHNAGMLGAQTLYKKLGFLPQVCRILIPFLIAGVLGFIMPELLGGGHHMVSMLYVENPQFGLLVTIVVVKFLFSAASFGSSAPGGTLVPLLVLGAFIGGAYGSAAVNWFGFDRDFATNLVIIAMAAFFAAIVRAPVTGIVLISELTGSFSHLLSLSTAALVAYVVAEALRSKPFFEHLTERFLEGQKGKVIVKGTAKKSIITSVIEEGSEADNCMIQDLGLPSSCLVVSVTRGAEELIPRGKLKLKAGDTLATMVSERDLAAMESVLKHKVTFEET